jgi:hypothetical protein
VLVQVLSGGQALVLVSSDSSPCQALIPNIFNTCDATEVMSFCALSVFIHRGSRLNIR